MKTQKRTVLITSQERLIGGYELTLCAHSTQNVCISSHVRIKNVINYIVSFLNWLLTVRSLLLQNIKFSFLICCSVRGMLPLFPLLHSQFAFASMMVHRCCSRLPHQGFFRNKAFNATFLSDSPKKGRGSKQEKNGILLSKVWWALTCCCEREKNLSRFFKK